MSIKTMFHKLSTIQRSDNKYIRGVMIAVLTYLSLLSISYVSEAKGNPQIFGKKIEAVFMAAAIAWLLLYYGRIGETRRKVITCIGGIILSFTHVYGNILHYKNDLFLNPGQVVQTLLAVAGVALLTVPLFALLLAGIDKLTDWWQQHSYSTEEKRPKHLFFRYWLGIFLCYIPVFLAYWPVNFVYDAKYQMTEVIVGPYKVHHPLLHTLLMGETYKLGGRLGSVSLGISFYTLIQMAVLSAALAYALAYLYDKGIPKAARVAFFLFLALFPMNSIFAISATKDVLFAAFFLFFMVAYLQIWEQGFIKSKVALLILAGILMVLFRKNAVYALVVALPFMSFANKGGKNKGRMALLLVSILLLSMIADKQLIRINHAVDDGNTREAMSVPLQQLARVACYRRGDLSDELYQEIILYMEPERIESYNPYLSDAVKNTANEQLLRTNKMNFFKLWAKVGLQFPGEYAESFLTNTLGYWYLGDTAHAMAAGDGIAVYHTLIEHGDEIIKKNYCKPVSMLLDPLFYHGNYLKTPIISILFRSCVYFWALLIYIFVMINRKEYKKLLPIALPVIYFASCFLGPMVALRYVYCIVICIPVLVALCFEKNKM